MTRQARREPSPWWSRSAAVAIGLVSTAMTLAATGVPAAAAPRPADHCDATTGVVVSVDFGHWGGPILRSCGTTPTTGYALLNQGGWHTAGTEHDGPGFICRIGYSGYHHGTQYPTPSQEPCVLTPPASAYWTYWQAGPGQNAWSYSQIGAMSYRPRPGSVTLWVFGGTNLSGTVGSAVPNISPDSLRASPAAGAASAGEPEIVNAAPMAASASISSGSPAPAIIALVVVLLMAAAGTAATRRRARREQPWR